MFKKANFITPYNCFRSRAKHISNPPSPDTAIATVFVDTLYVLQGFHGHENRFLKIKMRPSNNGLPLFLTCAMFLSKYTPFPLYISNVVNDWFRLLEVYEAYILTLRCLVSI